MFSIRGQVHHRATCCCRRPVPMWEDGYVRSLTLLPGTLEALGATAKPESVSLEKEDREEWGLDSVVDVLSLADGLLNALNDVGFFLFLKNLSEVVQEMRSVRAEAHRWGAAEVASCVEQALRPAQRTVFRLAPQKAYGTLLRMENFFEEFEDHVWGGKDTLEKLAALQEHLEDLQPKNLLNRLKNLHLVLTDNGHHLMWLATHPLVEEKLGRGNLFARLTVIPIGLGLAQPFLERMQEILEKFDRLQAIDLYD
ncbi:UNVERIFIED_CONTAM: hypothetical protein K2H54_072527 [Gekko kuhli]